MKSANGMMERKFTGLTERVDTIENKLNQVEITEVILDYVNAENRK